MEGENNALAFDVLALEKLKQLHNEFETEPWPEVFVPFWKEPDKIRKELNQIIENAKMSGGQSASGKHYLFYNNKLCSLKQRDLIQKYVVNLYEISVKKYIEAKYKYLSQYIALEITFPLSLSFSGNNSGHSVNKCVEQSESHIEVRICLQLPF